MEEKNREQSLLIGAPEKKRVMAPYAEKLFAMSFVWLCSIVAFGNAADFQQKSDGQCNRFCRVTIAFGVLSFLYMSMILLLNYMCSKGSMSRYGFFSHKIEVYLMGVLVAWWAIAVGASSAAQSDVPRTAHTFSWFALLGSIAAVYKAYHSFKEEDEPTVVPLNLDDGRYIYG